ncbi:hypothetical protein IAU59_005286 [Kwoniella sp. CBS 9459]
MSTEAAQAQQAPASAENRSAGPNPIGYKDDPCSLFSITQYQCTPLGGRVTCWPLERVFRQCGEGKPSIEVTNRLLPSSSPPSPPSSSNGKNNTAHNHGTGHGQKKKNKNSHAQSQAQNQTTAQAWQREQHEEMVVDPNFIANPPKARNWSDYRGQ